MRDIMDSVTNISWRTTSGATLGGFQYEYDAAGRVVSRCHALGDPSHPSQMSQSSQENYTYDDLDRLTNETVVGVAGTNTIIRHWDSFGRSLGYSLVGRDDPIAPQRQSTLAYDPAGRRVARGKSGSAFAQDDTVAYAYNNRSELTNAVAAVDSDYRYDYAFDAIGNRETSSERGTNSVYAANQLNQHCSITTLTSDVGLQTFSFSPQFDDDGNQTLVKTSNVMY